jgi:hypothetical protein
MGWGLGEWDEHEHERDSETAENESNPLRHARDGDVRAGIKNAKMLRETRIERGRSEKEE